jgi:hypothetical protein
MHAKNMISRIDMKVMPKNNPAFDPDATEKQK